MDTRLNLYPDKMIAQCINAISLISDANEALNSLKFEISEFVNDSYIHSVSFDELKKQCNNYLSVIDAMISCNEADIADFGILKSVLGGVHENLIGEKIDYWEKYYQALISKYNSLLESGVHSQLQAYFGTLLSTYQELYNMWYAKELLYYEVDEKTSSLFAKSYGRQAISNMLAGLKGSFSLNNGYDASLASRQVVEVKDATKGSMRMELEVSYNKQLDKLDLLLGMEINKHLLTEEKTKSMKAMGKVLLEEGYDWEFVVGAMANCLHEGNAGQFEVWGDNTRYAYRSNVNKACLAAGYNYPNDFSGKNISDVGMKKYIELMNICMNSDNPSNTKFGIGTFQWTEPSRAEKLMNLYVDECGGDCFPTEDQIINVESKMVESELKDPYYTKHVINKWNETSDKTVENAARIWAEGYEGQKGEEVAVRMQTAIILYEKICNEY